MDTNLNAQVSIVMNNLCYIVYNNITKAYNRLFESCVKYLAWLIIKYFYEITTYYNF